MEAARYANWITPDYDPDSIRSDAKGQNSASVLTIGYNEPKGQESLGGAVTKLLLEHYMRRPSLKEEALKKLTEFAHDAIAVKQSPGYPVECAIAALFTQGDKFRWLGMGDVRMYHFVNGQIMEASKGDKPAMGAGREKTVPDVIEETSFGRGDNSFLLCSGSLARTLRESELENTLATADSAEDWLKSLKELYEDRNSEDPVSIMTLFVPERKKRMSKKVLIAIIVVVVLVVGGFFVMGAIRRRNEGPGGPGGPGQPPQQQGMPGVEPTQPPAPPEGGGQPGVQPTQPAPPTQPPAPEAPSAPGAAENGQVPELEEAPAT